MANIMEKEVKYCVKDPLELINRIKSQNAIFVGYCFEKTTRVDVPNWTLSNSGTFLRLRSGFKNTLTLKNSRKKDSEVSERKEIEIEIDDIDICHDLLKALGLTESLVMEKYRMMWKINDLFITIDELPFGVYTEFEGPIPSIKIISDLLQFNFNERIILTYWELYNNFMISQGNTYYDPNIVFPQNYISRLLMNE